MKKVTLVFVTIMLLAVTASAANQPCDREWSIFGDYTHTPTKTVGSDDAAGLGLGISQYVTNEVSVGLQGWHNWGSRGNAGFIGVNAKYHFMPMNSVNPYVGGQLNYAMAGSTHNSLVICDLSSMNDGVMWGPIVGVAFSCADKTSLFVEYQWQLYDGGIRSYAKEGSSIVVGVAMGY